MNDADFMSSMHYCTVNLDEIIRHRTSETGKEIAQATNNVEEKAIQKFECSISCYSEALKQCSPMRQVPLLLRSDLA